MIKSMDVFQLRRTLVHEYEQFATSFTTIKAGDIEQQVRAVYAEQRYWPEPLSQINPHYERKWSVGQMVDGGMLHATCGEIFRTGPGPDGVPLNLYTHQVDACSVAAQGESYVVTTGTGSGKSLCFFIPIVDAILKEKDPGRSEADPCDHHLPDERARELAARGAAQVRWQRRRSRSSATPGRRAWRPGSGSRTARPTSCSPTS